jgi:hypothetical protein
MKAWRKAHSAERKKGASESIEISSTLSAQLLGESVGDQKTGSGFF